MDFSSCINFDDAEDKVVVAKPKIIIRKTSIYSKVAAKPKTNENYSEQLKSFHHGRPVINFPLFKKTRKGKNPGRGFKGALGKSEFTSTNVMMANLSYFHLHDEKSIPSPECSENIRQSNKDVRRVKWQRAKLRSKSYVSPELALARTEKIVPTSNKKQVFQRPRMKSSNKASFFHLKKEERPELRILGVSKDFEVK